MEPYIKSGSSCIKRKRGLKIGVHVEVKNGFDFLNMQHSKFVSICNTPGILFLDKNRHNRQIGYRRD